MRPLINHFYNSQKIKRLLKNCNSNDLSKNLFWYDLSIGYASSISGFFKVFFWKLKQNFLQSFIMFFSKKKNMYNADYQQQNPKNYGTESIYHKVIPVKKLNISNPSIWNLKNIHSKPWFGSDHWSKYLEDNVEIIKNEFFESNLESTEHPGNKMLAENGNWSSITLIGAHGVNNDYSKKFPKTLSLLKKMPVNNIFGFVAFSKLSPGTHIKPHTGSSNLRLRYHLGIKVPKQDNIKIRVGNETRPWLQDRCIVFDDSFEHEVFHNGNKERIVFIVDLWHPDINNDVKVALNSDEFKNFGKLYNKI